MSRTLYDLIGLAAGIAFILALKGLSHPKTARRGNLIGAFGAGLATLVVFFYSNENSSLPLNNLGWILGAIAIGLVIGVPAARKVQMTQMPQLVALFNGVGGGAAALVAIVSIFVLSVFVGFEVVSKVSSTLHTPLMSGANAIHGVILVGAIIVADHSTTNLELGLSVAAIILATINMVGGFVVTDRMLEMFKGNKK